MLRTAHVCLLYPCRFWSVVFVWIGWASLWLGPALAVPAQQAKPAQSVQPVQPVHIEAQSLRYDERRRHSVFSGSVVMTQGTIVLRADRMDFYEDQQGQVHGTMQSIDGRIASFRQRREEYDEVVEGEAQTITYDAATQTVTLRNQARLRKYRGAVLTDAFEAQTILYDGSADRFELLGLPSTGTSAVAGSSAGERVRAMLSPHASAPDIPASDAVPLRSSMGIGSSSR